MQGNTTTSGGSGNSERTVESIKKRFNRSTKARARTGDPNLPKEIKLAKQAAARIVQKAEIEVGNESEVTQEEVDNQQDDKDYGDSDTSYEDDDEKIEDATNNEDVDEEEDEEETSQNGVDTQSINDIIDDFEQEANMDNEIPPLPSLPTEPPQNETESSRIEPLETTAPTIIPGSESQAAPPNSRTRQLASVATDTTPRAAVGHRRLSSMSPSLRKRAKIIRKKTKTPPQVTGEKDSLVEMLKLNMIQRMNQDAAAEKVREAERKSEREREERRYAIEMAKCEQEKQRHEQMMAQINGQNANF